MSFLPPLRSATAEPPNERHRDQAAVAAPHREVKLVAIHKRSPTKLDSPAVAAEAARRRHERQRWRQEEELRAQRNSQREMGFRYNAFAIPAVFSTYGVDMLVLKDRERREIEIAVAQRRAQMELDRKARALSKADALRRKKAEQDRVAREHALTVAQQEELLLRKAEEAAARRKKKTRATGFVARRNEELQAAKRLAERREEVRKNRRHGDADRRRAAVNNSSEHTTPAAEDASRWSLAERLVSRVLRGLTLL